MISRMLFQEGGQKPRLLSLAHSRCVGVESALVGKGKVFSLLAHNDVVQNLNPQELACLVEAGGESSVFTAGLRIATQTLGVKSSEITSPPSL